MATAFSRFWLIVERSHVGAGSVIFDTPSHKSFPHMLWKFQTQATQGQVTRSRQVTSHQKKVWTLVIATPNDWSTWNFQRLISLTVSIKCIVRNLDIGDARSGRFCDLSITYLDVIYRRLFWTKIIWNTLKHRVTVELDTLNQNIATSYPSTCRVGHFR